MSILSSQAIETSAPSIIAIIQLFIMVIAVPIIGYLYKQVSSIATAITLLTERQRTTASDIQEMKHDIKQVRNRGTRNPPADRDNVES